MWQQNIQIFQWTIYFIVLCNKLRLWGWNLPIRIYLSRHLPLFFGSVVRTTVYCLKSIHCCDLRGWCPDDKLAFNHQQRFRFNLHRRLNRLLAMTNMIKTFKQYPLKYDYTISINGWIKKRWHIRVNIRVKGNISQLIYEFHYCVSAIWVCSVLAWHNNSHAISVLLPIPQTIPTSNI